MVLTPAVYAAARAARAEPLPYLFVCAFVANAASFVLPISNPANMVGYTSAPPPLPVWLAHFALPSIAAIGATYAGLRFSARRSLRAPVACVVDLAPLPAGGVTAAVGIAATSAILLAASAFCAKLGLAIFAAGLATAAIVLLRARQAPWPSLGGIAWSVLPLVGALFVLVAGLARTGLFQQLGAMLGPAAHAAPRGTALGAGRWRNGRFAV